MYQFKGASRYMGSLWRALIKLQKCEGTTKDGKPKLFLPPQPPNQSGNQLETKCHNLYTSLPPKGVAKLELRRALQNFGKSVAHSQMTFNISLMKCLKDA